MYEKELLTEIIKLRQRLDEQNLLTKNILTLREAAAYSGIKESSLYKLTSNGRIPFSKPGGKLIYIHKKDLDSFLLSNRQASKEEINQAADVYLARQGKVK